MMAFWLVTTSFSGERKSKTMTNPRSGFSPVTRTLPSTEILAASRTALVSKIWTSAGFFAFCCAAAANKARHSNAMVETLMRPSVSGAFRHLGIGRGFITPATSRAGSLHVVDENGIPGASVGSALAEISQIVLVTLGEQETRQEVHTDRVATRLRPIVTRQRGIIGGR